MNASDLLDIVGEVPTTVRQLANGLTVVVRELRAAPVVALVTHVRAGYLDEEDDGVGIAHVLEHMYFKGTGRRGPGEMARETKAAGGYLNASTSYDHTRYYTVLPAASLEQGMQLQADALKDSVVDADELSRELRVIIEEAKRKRDTPTALARETMYATLFDAHRMRRWRIGTEEQLSRYGRDDVMAFYRGRYRPEHIVVSIAGDVEADAALALAEDAYGDLPIVDAEPSIGPAEPQRREFRYRALSGDVTRAYVEWGWRGAASVAAHTPALDLLSTVFGRGRASRLYREVREPGHALAIGSGHFSTRDIGVFEIAAQARADEVEVTLRAIADSLRRMLDGPIREEEVERAHRLLVAGTLRRLETAEGQANFVADWQALGDWRLSLDYLRTALATDATLLGTLAREHLDPEAATLLVYGPASVDPADPAEVARRLFGGAPAAVDAAPAAPAIIGAPGTASFDAEEDGVRFYRSDGGRIAIQPVAGSGLVTLGIAIPGGVVDERPDAAGTTSLLMRVSTRGTERYDADAIALAAEAMGSTIHALAGADRFEWRMTVPAAEAATAVRLLAEVAFAPTFPEEAVDRERRNALDDVAQIRDDMHRYPLALMFGAAWGDHPYGYPIEAFEAALPGTGRADVAAWHGARLRAATPWFIVAGDVDSDRLADVIAGAAPAAGEHGVVIREGPAWPDRPVSARAERDRAQTALALGMPGPHRGHEDLYPLRLAGTAVAGLGGRAFEELRSRRSLAYTVSLRPQARRTAGAFVGYIATSPGREAEAHDALLAEMLRLAETGVEEDELERARRYLLGAWDIRRQTTAELHGDLVDALVTGRGLSEIREHHDRVRAVTVAGVREAAARWFDAGRVVSGVVAGRSA